MNQMRSIIGGLLTAALLAGCQAKPKPYGVEAQDFLPGAKRQVWAVAPAVNISGQTVDPLIQADDLFQQLQQIHGLTVIPVNRVAEVFAALKIARVQSAQQASIVCEQLGADALIVPTITIFDPYDPPKMGASLQLFRKGQTGSEANVDVHALLRDATPPPQAVLPAPTQAGFKQSVGMFDAADGSVLQQMQTYANGREDPVGPLGNREYLMNMDRYSGFVYHQLIVDLLRSMNTKGSGENAVARK